MHLKIVYSEVELSNSITIETLDSEVHRLCGLYAQGFFKEALSQTKNLLRQFPTSTALYIISGDACTKLKQFDDAILHYNKAIELNPNFAAGYFNLGVAQQDKGDIKLALESYKMALKLNPNYLEAYFNMGGVLHEIGNFEEALDNYKYILKLKPDHPDTYNNMGNTLKEMGQPELAIKYFKKAIKLNSNFAEAYNNQGNWFRDEGFLNESIVSLEMAISLKENYQEAFFNLGNSLKDQGKYDSALNYYDKATKNNYFPEAKHERIYLRQQICEWSELEQLEKEFPKLGITDSSVKPFPFFSFEDDPKRQLIRASKYVSETHNIEPIPLDRAPKSRSNKIRVGYFSADFRDHAVSHQISKVLALHDRSKIEVYAYSFGQADDDMRKRIISAVDHFKDVTDMSDKDVALLAREDKIDIAIDLMGYTKGSRPQIFAHRAAPIQIHLFGGTTGAQFIDYVIADHIVIPDRLRQYYQEKIIYLPHSYMPTDNTLEISDTIMTREDMGLPEDGFVFCCFNNNFKITPREFDIWMRLLHKVEGSVLWLKEANQWAKSNLQKEATKRGIDPSRLIFTTRLSTEDHLARHRLADLFLDTFNFNAHSTASDALWAGLPIITKKGEQFVARCAASFLNTIGLPEMITTTEKDYEELAFKLATDKSLLSSIRERLAKNRLSTPLFNTEKYTKDLEAALDKVYSINNGQNV